MRKGEKCIKAIVRNILRTYKNKLCALSMVAIGVLSMVISKDGTAFALLMFIAVLLFIERENVIY